MRKIRQEAEFDREFRACSNAGIKKFINTCTLIGVLLLVVAIRRYTAAL